MGCKRAWSDRNMALRMARRGAVISRPGDLQRASHSGNALLSVSATVRTGSNGAGGTFQYLDNERTIVGRHQRSLKSDIARPATTAGAAPVAGR
jgi:hypothetical protein